MTEVFYYDTTTINDQEYFLAATSLGIAYLGLKSQDNSTPIFGFYPNKMLIHDPKRLEPYVKELKEYFAGKDENLMCQLIFLNLVLLFKEAF